MTVVEIQGLEGLGSFGSLNFQKQFTPEIMCIDSYLHHFQFLYLTAVFLGIAYLRLLTQMNVNSKLGKVNQFLAPAFSDRTVNGGSGLPLNSTALTTFSDHSLLLNFSMDLRTPVLIYQLVRDTFGMLSIDFKN